MTEPEYRTFMREPHKHTQGVSDGNLLHSWRTSLTGSPTKSSLGESDSLLSSVIHWRFFSCLCDFAMFLSHLTTVLFVLFITLVSTHDQIGGNCTEKHKGVRKEWYQASIALLSPCVTNNTQGSVVAIRATAVYRGSPLSGRKSPET